MKFVIGAGAWSKSDDVNPIGDEDEGHIEDNNNGNSYDFGGESGTIVIDVIMDEGEEEIEEIEKVRQAEEWN